MIQARAGLGALLLILLLAPAPAVPAQDSGEPSGPPTADKLLEETRSLDIQTASYYELLAWVRELGLDDTGGRAALQQRLLDHYHLKPERTLTEEEKKRSLQVESAREAEYFTIEEVEEKYIVLRGGVRVELREGEVLHSIRAEKITLNQTENILTAEGGVEYVMRQGERTERFDGESLTFNTKTLQGVFFRGGTAMEQAVEGKKFTFRFTGNSISRMENNTVMMENARVTSSRQDDPYYHIRARKLWVLDSGDWAVQNAVLYIGRVPMVYLPFFFYPGDEFFFHPVIGSRPREGSFLQTTTYLIGQKKKRQTPFSILQMDEDQQQQSRVRRSGLFLTDVPGTSVAPESLDRFLKVLVDVYSRLGAFAGLAGSFPPSVSFQAGIGLSRSLFEEGGTYTPYYPDPDDPLGRYRSYWNRSLLFGLPVPFRYGLDLRWTLGADPFKFSGTFEFYSDPSFPRDFHDRAEEINWSGMLGLEGQSTQMAASTEKLNLTWELTAQAELGSVVDSPRLKTFSVPYFQAKLFWQSRLLESMDAVQEADPGRRFYYPVSLQFPSVAMNLAGEIFRWSSREQAAKRGEGTGTASGADTTAGPAAAPSGAPPADGAGDPSGAGQTAGGSEAPAERTEDAAGGAAVLRMPELQPDLPGPKERELLTFRLGYQFRPDLIVEQIFDTGSWKAPEDIDYSVLYTTTRVTDTTGLNYQLNVLEDFLGVGGGLTFQGTYRDRLRGSAAEDLAWQNLVKGDNSQSMIDLSTQFNVSLRPLLDVPDFSGSKLSYSLNWVYYSYRLDTAVSTWDDPVYRSYGPSWLPETVKSHEAQAVLQYKPLDVAHTLSLTAALPPDPASLTGRLQFTVWLLTTTVNSVLRQDGGNWDLQPLVVQESLKLGDDLTLGDELRFDLGEGLLVRNTASLAWSGLKTSLTAERLPPLTFDGSEWTEGSGERFQLTQFAVGYDLKPEPLYFWKDRIRLETGLNAAWNIDFREPTENSLDFIFSFKFYVHEFLELSFTSVSFNNQTYRYFPALAGKLGEVPVNPFYDLLRSFNFFNPQDRRDSAFKLRSISVSAVHHLHDWDLVATYEGKPTLFSESGRYEYRWQNTLVILLKWAPLPEVRSRMWLDSTGFYLRN